MDILHEDQYTFMILSRSVLIIRNAADKSCRENQNTYFMFNNFFFFRKLCRLRHMWKNMVTPERTYMTI